MNSDTKFHGIIGDCNPLEHDGGVVYQEGEQSPEMLYFWGWADDDGPRVTVSCFCVEDDALVDLNWVNWDSVASYIGMDVEELKGYAVSDNVLERAQVYVSVAAHYGFGELDTQPEELTFGQAEERYGEVVDRAHQAV